MIIVGVSAANNVPAFFFGSITNAGPAKLLISQKVLDTFDVSDYIGSLSFKGF